MVSIAQIFALESNIYEPCSDASKSIAIVLKYTEFTLEFPLEKVAFLANFETGQKNPLSRSTPVMSE